MIPAHEEKTNIIEGEKVREGTIHEEESTELYIAAQKRERS